MALSFENIVVILIIISFFMTFVAFFMIAKRGPTHSEKQLRKLADELGFSLLGGEPVLPKVRFLRFIKTPLSVVSPDPNNALKIYHFTRGSGKNSTTYAAIQFSNLNTKELKCEIYEQGLLSKIGKTLGMQDIPVGNAKFDERFIIKSDDQNFIRTILLPEIQERILEAWDQQNARGRITLNNNILAYEEIGTIRDDATRERFKYMLSVMYLLRDAIDVYISR